MSKQNTTKKTQFFRIHVRPDKTKYSAIQGNVDPNREIIVGNSYEVKLNPPAQIIPNWYEAKVVKEYNKTTNAYEGKFEWYDSGKHKDKNPETIIVRYLSSTASLDSKWQDEKGFKPLNEQEEVGWEFPSGEITDIPLSEITPKFIEFLEHHEMNGDNPNRDASNLVGFYIVDANKNIQKRVDNIERMEEMVKTMKSIRSDEGYTLCYASILGIKEGLSFEEKADIILEMMEENYDNVDSKYMEWIKSVNTRLLKAVKSKRLEDKDGVILLDGNVLFDGKPMDTKQNGIMHKLIELYTTEFEAKKEIDKILKLIK